MIRPSYSPTLSSHPRTPRSGAWVALLLLLGVLCLPPAGAASWQRVGDMAEPRNWPTAILLQDGTVLVSGGARREGEDRIALDSAEQFDPRTNRFLPQSRMGEKHVGHAAV
jgi:hypothetical protein